MTDIKCNYCNNELINPSREASRSYTAIFSTYYCDDCQAEYTILGEARIVDFALRSGDYRIRFDLTNGSCELRFLKPYQIAGLPYYNCWTRILSLGRSPTNVTPENVGSKIKTMLLFL